MPDEGDHEITGPYVTEIIAAIKRACGGGNSEMMVVSQEAWRYWEAQVTKRHNQEAI